IIAGKAKDTRRVLIGSSDDDGVSWSKPVDITASTKLPEWTWYATGPGVGIQLRGGRLLIPCDHRVLGSSKYRSHVIYSDDHGKNWKLGGVVGEDVNECQVVELGDGSVMINLRSYRANQRCRAVSISNDRGQNWSGIVDDSILIEPNCQASLVGYAGDAAHKPFVLFCNPASQQKREKLTIRASQDEGRTWPNSMLIYEGSSAYSCLTILPNVTVGCLYERDNYGKITFVRVGLESP
ncbi:MAG TPA: sialidase family protein, partial [Tepidisphaeraceae bacterium]|nr:sialidase family protein [Tepidisphaeraceae bacterium]